MDIVDRLRGKFSAVDLLAVIEGTAGDIREEAAATIEDLRTRVAELEPDAARYRWEREHPAWDTEAALGGMTPEQYDAAIDAAMKG